MVRPIPLKVKNQDITKDVQVTSSLELAIMIILLIASTTLITIVVLSSMKKNDEHVKQIQNEANIIGDWYTDTGELISISNNNMFSIYDSYEEKDNNFYTGTYTVKNGEEALLEMNNTVEDFETNTDNIDIKNIYSIKVKPTLHYEDGKDITSKLSEEESWWFIIILKNDKEAFAINKTLDIKYKLVKN